MNSAVENIRREQLTMIGGSQIAAVFNLDYGCRRQLVYRLIGQQPDHEFHGNEFTERGLKLEPLIAEEFAEQSGYRVRQTAGGSIGKAKRHPQYSYIGCHSDREIVGVDQDVKDAKGRVVNPRRGPGLLSIKSRSAESYARLMKEGLPYADLLQIQYEMAIWKREWGVVVIAFFTGEMWKLKWFPVAYDSGLAQEVYLGVHRTWGIVQKIFDEPQMTPYLLPDKLEASDKRCGKCPYRVACQGEEMREQWEAYQLRHDASTKDLPVIAGSIADKVTELVQVKAVGEEAEEMAGILRNEVIMLLADVDKCQIPDGTKVSHRIQEGRQTIQTKPLVGYLTDIARYADAIQFIDTQRSDRTHTDEEWALIATLVSYVREIPGAIKNKFTNTGAPFHVLTVTPPKERS